LKVCNLATLVVISDGDAAAKERQREKVFFVNFIRSIVAASIVHMFEKQHVAFLAAKQLNMFLICKHVSSDRPFILG
jgi:hypothetical protein